MLDACQMDAVNLTQDKLLLLDAYEISTREISAYRHVDECQFDVFFDTIISLLDKKILR